MPPLKSKGLSRMQAVWDSVIEYLRAREMWIGSMMIALLGRLIYHSQMVRSGHRKFWSRNLWLEIPIAAGMGVIGQGLCLLIGIKGGGEAAIIGIIAHQGPRALDALFNFSMDRLKTGGDK